MRANVTAEWRCAEVNKYHGKKGRVYGDKWKCRELANGRFQRRTLASHTRRVEKHRFGRRRVIGPRTAGLADVASTASERETAGDEERPAERTTAVGAQALTWRFFHKIERSAVHDRRILAQRDGRLEGARGVLSGHDGRPGSPGWRFRRVRRRETGHVDKFPVSAATRTRTKIAALDGAAAVPGRRTPTAVSLARPKPLAIPETRLHSVCDYVVVSRWNRKIAFWTLSVLCTTLLFMFTWSLISGFRGC